MLSGIKTVLHRHGNNRNLELLSYEQKAKSLAQENEILRKQMGTLQTKSLQSVPAIVLFSGPYLLLASGLNDGIKVGQSVVIFDNFLGKVITVNPRTSIVQLTSNPLAKTPVKIGTVRGLVTGQFNSSMSLEKISANEIINTDDIVLTSGEGDLLPDLIVGKIGKIEKVETDLFQKAIVLPMVNLTQLTTVFIITE